MAAGDLITEISQIEWRGVLWGRDTGFPWAGLEGWDDLPEMESSGASRPARHGSWPGRLLAGERVVTVTMAIDATPDTVADELRALRAITAPADDDTVWPLVVSHYETLLAWAQVRRRAIPTDAGLLVGAPKVTLQFTCPDPRRYGLTLHERMVGAPSPPSGGLVYPLTYPLDYGTPPGPPGSATAANAGDVPSSPIFVVMGPISGPQILNQTSGIRIGFDLTLAPEASLTIDTDAGTVRLASGADRLYTLTVQSVPVEDMVLPPGDNTITLLGSTTDTSTSLTIRWRDAYL